MLGLGLGIGDGPSRGGSAALPYDPYWDNVVLALHFDGADDGTVVTDETGGHTANLNGGFVTKTAIKKFGTASGYFDGINNSVTFPDNSQFNITGVDYTIDMWVYITALPTVGAWSTLIAKHYNTAGYRLLYNSDRKFHFSTDTGTANGFTTFADSFELNTWHHVTAVGSSGASLCFVDGILRGYTASHTITNQTVTLKIGTTDGSAWWHTGYIDDLRLTKGVARWTSNFTPPTKEFYTVGP